jgi:hypothetical protein
MHIGMAREGTPNIDVHSEPVINIGLARLHIADRRIASPWHNAPDSISIPLSLAPEGAPDMQHVRRSGTAGPENLPFERLLLFKLKAPER